ncbi:unnamed protein product, partial [Lymnaea stagnalis]
PQYSPPGQPQYSPTGQPQYSPAGQPQYSPTGQPQYSPGIPDQPLADQGYQGTPTGANQRAEPRRISGRDPRDYPDIPMGSRQGSVKSVQGGPQNPPIGSTRSLTGGARSRRSTGSSIYGLLVEGLVLNGGDMAELLHYG